MFHRAYSFIMFTILTVLSPLVHSSSAAFVGVQVPAEMTAGQTYAVAVMMQNTNINTWTPETLFRLGAIHPQDNMTWGINRVDVPEVVGPGQYVWFRFNVTAPPTPGEYQFSWRMVQEGLEWFGEMFPYTPVIVTGAPVAPVNAPPSISLTSPANNATYSDPAIISLTADAIDSDGSISKVEFHEGANYLGVDINGADGWGITWANVPPGTYSISATATDNTKAATTSPAANVTVPTASFGTLYAYSHQRLYRTHNAAVTDNFYTVSKDQRDIAINQHGYQDMGYVAYVPSTNDGTALPFHRFFKGAPQIEHVYTISDLEYSQILGWGYVYEGVEGYLYPRQERNTAPLHRLAKFDNGTGDLQHIYTTDSEEMNIYRYQGWGYDGPAGYVFAPPSPYASPNPSVHFVTRSSCFGSGCYQGYISIPAFSTGMYSGLCGGTVVISRPGGTPQTLDNFSFQADPYNGHLFGYGCYAPAHLQPGTTTLLEFSGYTVAYRDGEVRWVQNPSARLVNVR